MAAQERGHAPLPNGKGRAVLSVRDPIVERLLAGLGVELDHIADLRQFAKNLTHERNQWSIAHGGGLFGRRLDKSDADRALKRAFVTIGGAT